MITKLLGLVIAMCCAELSIIGNQSANDPLFLFISNNKVVVLGRLIIVFFILVLSFKKRLHSNMSRIMTAALGAILLVFGAAGATSQTVTDTLGSYIKVFDFWMMIEMGIILSLIALTYKVSSRKASLSQPVIYHYNRFRKAIGHV